MKDAFGVSKGASTAPRLIPTYMKRAAARRAGARARGAFNRGFKPEPAQPTPVPRPWYRKGSNQALMGLGAVGLGAGTIYGYKRAKNNQPLSPVGKSFARIGGQVDSKGETVRKSYPKYGLIKNLPGKRRIIKIDGDTVHFEEEGVASRTAHRSRVTFLQDKPLAQPKWVQGTLFKRG